MVEPALSPAEATPLDVVSRKRKRSDAAVLNHPGDNAHPQPPIVSQGDPGDEDEDGISENTDTNNDDHDDSGDDSMMDDIVDSYELDPYTPSIQPIALPPLSLPAC